jgi:hypothetical protein
VLLFSATTIVMVPCIALTGHKAVDKMRDTKAQSWHQTQSTHQLVQWATLILPTENYSLHKLSTLICLVWFRASKNNAIWEATLSRMKGAMLEMLREGSSLYK